MPGNASPATEPHLDDPVRWSGLGTQGGPDLGGGGGSTTPSTEHADRDDRRPCIIGQSGHRGDRGRL